MTDTEAEAKGEPSPNLLQESRLAAPQQQQQQQKEPDSDAHPNFEPKPRISAESLPKSNSNPQCRLADNSEQAHPGDASNYQEGHPDSVSQALNPQETTLPQNQGHGNALGHQIGPKSDGSSVRWAKKKAPKMPPLHIGGDDYIYLMNLYVTYAGGEAHHNVEPIY